MDVEMVLRVSLLLTTSFGKPDTPDGSVEGNSLAEAPRTFSGARAERAATTTATTTTPIPLPVPRVYRPGDYEGFWYSAVWWLVETQKDARRTEVGRCMATFISERIAVTACECVVVVDKSTYTVAAYSHDGWLQWLIEDDEEKKYENRNGQILKKKDPKNFHLDAIFHPELKGKKVEEIYIHDQCRSFFKYNFAMVSIEELTQEEMTYMKSSWVHTPEDILFMSNMRRIVSAQAILGNCKLPWTDENKIGMPGKVEEDSYEVNFMQWDFCRPIVCPGWNLSYPDFDDWHFQVKTLNPESINPYVKDVCVDSVDHTKWCVHITVPAEKRKNTCRLPPGTPVYCEVQRIQGIVGFLVSQTFACSSTTEEATSKIAVFQPLDVGMPWIKNATGSRLDPGYPQSITALLQNENIPGWIWGLKKVSLPQIYNAETQQKSLEEDPDAVEVYTVFAKDQSDAIVNVYAVQKDFSFLCHGIQVIAKKFVVPCWCVFRLKGQQSRLQWGDPGEVKRRGSMLQGRDPKNLQVRLAKNDNKKKECITLTDEEYKTTQFPELRGRYSKAVYCQPVLQVTKGQKCNSRLFADFALISTEVPIIYAKNAWIHTSNVVYFQKVWAFLPAATLVEGKCFYFRFDYFEEEVDGFTYSTLKYYRTLITFSPFDFCTPLVCDPEENYSDAFEQEFCYNKAVALQKGPPFVSAYNATRTKSPNNARECITSVKANCGILDGTPIFCDLDELRGLVGFVSRANMPGCFQKEVNSKGKDPREVVDRVGAGNSAIIMRIDMYLAEIKENTVIYWLEKSKGFGGKSGSAMAKIPALISLITLITVHFWRRNGF